MSEWVNIPRGKWAKLILAAAPLITSGHDYDGDWLTAGAQCSLAPGSIIVVGDEKGNGADAYVVFRRPTWTPAGVVMKADVGHLAGDTTKDWAGRIARPVAEALARPHLEREHDAQELWAARVRDKIAGTTTVTKWVDGMQSPAVACERWATLLAEYERARRDHGGYPPPPVPRVDADALAWQACEALAAATSPLDMEAARTLAKAAIDARRQ